MYEIINNRNSIMSVASSLQSFVLENVPFIKKSLIDYTLDIAGRLITDFHFPTKDEVTTIKNLFIVLKKINDDFEKTAKDKEIKTDVSMSIFNKVSEQFIVNRPTEDPTSLIFTGRDKASMNVSFVWRTINTDNLIIEDPHELGDGVQKLCPVLFLNTKARLWYMSAINKSSTKKKTSGGKSMSDGAHRRNTLFHQGHKVLYELYPDMVCVQVHGMKSNLQNSNGGLPLAFMIWNGIKNGFKKGDIAYFLAAAIPRCFPKSICSRTAIFASIEDQISRDMYGTDWLDTDINKKLPLAIKGRINETVLVGRSQQSGPTTNIQGRHLNNKTDTRRFVEIETAPIIRKNPENALKFAQTINCAMEYWKKYYSTNDFAEPSITEDDNDDIINDDNGIETEE